MAKKNLLIKLLSIISYKEKKDIRKFHIPELKEGQEPSASPGEKTERAAAVSTETNSKSSDNPGKAKVFKKPVPAVEARGERNCSITKRDIRDEKSHIREKIAFLEETFNSPVNKDFIVREFIVAQKHRAFIAYLEGMVDRITINNSILRPLLHRTDNDTDEKGCSLEYLLMNVLETNQAKEVIDPEELIYELLSGNTCLYVDGCEYYLSCETKGFEKRAVDKPQTEGVVRGPQEAFNENLRTNVTLIRRLIKDRNLTSEFMKVGKRNKTLCAIMYIDGLINPAIVKEIKRRLKGISADMVFGDGMLEQFIEDRPYTLIPTIINTERPDRTASHLLEGRAAIISDGAPFALIVPVTLHSFLHTPEETYLRWPYGTFIRIVRAFAISVATLLPAVYIGLVGFHREMLPTDLMIAIVSAKENVPFPTLVEILLMEISFELIREAGIRIPGIIGNTLGIIGALILGQAAVQANIVSPVLIIIVAVTGLGNFAIPNFSVAFAVRAIRFAFILSAALMGFYGIGLMLIALLALLANMESFGVPFLSITAPKTSSSGDLFQKKPVWMQEMRPDNINPLDVRRQPEISRKWAVEDVQIDNTEDEGQQDD